MVISNYLEPGIIYRLTILSDGSTIIRIDHDGKRKIYREVEYLSAPNNPDFEKLHKE
jgi:hypothetical protein